MNYKLLHIYYLYLSKQADVVQQTSFSYWTSFPYMASLDVSMMTFLIPTTSNPNWLRLRNSKSHTMPYKLHIRTVKSQRCRVQGKKRKDLMCKRSRCEETCLHGDLVGQHLWILLALVMAAWTKCQPVHPDQFPPQRSGLSAAKHLVGGVGETIREERHIAGWRLLWLQLSLQSHGGRVTVWCLLTTCSCIVACRQSSH